MSSRLVLVFAADAELVARARGAAPGLPIVRTRYPRTALEFVRTMRPAAVLLSTALPASDVSEVRAEALACGASVVAVSEGVGEGDLSAAMRRAIDDRDAALLVGLPEAAR